MIRTKRAALGLAARCRKISCDASEQVAPQLRSILREIAQPVAVVTTRIHNPRTLSSGTSDDHSMTHDERIFHGATLSSFTSIAMHPVPLISFSLKVPSRMATSLVSGSPNALSHMVINLLCASQASTATQFARPDIYPTPFTLAAFDLTTDGLPILRGSLGAISCKMVGKSWPLRDLGNGSEQWEAKSPIENATPLTSELFIAEVVRIERVAELEGQDD